MGTFVYFTDDQKLLANSVDLAEFLRRRGEKLIRSGREYRLSSNHSVTVRGNEWFDHADERGGHAVSFVQKHYGLSYPDAVLMLLGGEQGIAYPPAQERARRQSPLAAPAFDTAGLRLSGEAAAYRPGGHRYLCHSRIAL